MNRRYLEVSCPPLATAFGALDRRTQSSFGAEMSKPPPLNSANIKRLAASKAHKEELWDAVKYVIVEMRSQFPAKGTGTPAEPFPPVPAIVDWLNHFEFKTTHNKAINYNTVSRLLTSYFDEWMKIPSARQMEDELPSPRIHVLGRFRLLEDLGEFCEGDYGQVEEITEQGVIGFLTDWDSVRIRDPEHTRILIRPHQMRMVAANLHDWYAAPGEADPNRFADRLEEGDSEGLT